MALLALSVSTGLHPAFTATRANRETGILLAAGLATPESRNRASVLIEASLANQPLDGAVWLRKAYVLSLENGRLDAAANAAIERSYAVEPLGSEITLWRVAFVFDHWSSAAPEIRRLALSEMEAVYPRRSWDFDGVAPTVLDPTGRMVATIATRRLRENLSPGPSQPGPSETD